MIWSASASPKRRELCDQTGAGRLRQIVDRLDAELGPQLPGLLRAHTRQPHHLDQRLRNVLAQLRQDPQVAGLHQLANVVRHLLADRRKIRQIDRLGDHLAQRRRILGHGARRIAIGPHPKRVGVLDLQQIRHLLEDLRDLEILHPQPSAAAHVIAGPTALQSSLWNFRRAGTR